VLGAVIIEIKLRPFFIGIHHAHFEHNFLPPVLPDEISKRRSFFVHFIRPVSVCP
jgi:hypothetical protein